MNNREILIYHKNKFEEFIQVYSCEYTIIPFTTLMDLSFQFLEQDWLEEAYLIDITTLIKSAAARSDIVVHYELWLNYIFEQQNVDLVFEDSYWDIALNIFPHHFRSRRYITTEITEEVGEEKKEPVPHLKDVYIYNETQLPSLLLERNSRNIEVISLSKLIQKNNLIDYYIEFEKINKSKHYEIDLTSVIKHLRIRSDIVLNFELILHKLSEYDNIDFIMDKDVEDDCKKIFTYHFQKYITLNEINTDIENKSLKSRGIIDLTKFEMEEFWLKFYEQLFGHEIFKEDLKRQAETFVLLNKMKRSKIFSIFICGESGLGKTEVARILHRNLSPEAKEIKINFGNYSGQGSLWSLIGSP